MRGLLRPFLLPLLRRPDDDVARRSRRFSIATPEGRALVEGVGDAFLGGYHRMLEARSLEDVASQGHRVAPHFRPFFFEGAAMGYLPRSWFRSGTGPQRIERDLLRMDQRYRYLYYVGIGFWYGFRHPHGPAALESMASHLDPFHFPLCYDGYGFKLGFFDFPEREAALAVLDRAPRDRRAPVYQGFGRALHFVCMDDEARYRKIRSRLPVEHRADIESGRALAVGFTGIHQPGRLLAHVDAAAEDWERDARLLGITWALTARAMNDADYFGSCLASLSPRDRSVLARLPELCREAAERASDYGAWRALTQAAAGGAYASHREVMRS